MAFADIAAVISRSFPTPIAAPIPTPIPITPPNALVVANAAADAVHMIGMLAAGLILAEAVVYVATAPKSNASYMALNKAMEMIKNDETPRVPTHLMDAHYKGAAKLGHGLGYKYAHDYKNHYVKQQYLPDKIKNKKYYQPKNNKYEINLNNINKEMKKWI